jgi:hypothetical protein
MLFSEIEMAPPTKRHSKESRKHKTQSVQRAISSRDVMSKMADQKEIGKFLPLALWVNETLEMAAEVAGIRISTQPFEVERAIRSTALHLDYKWSNTPGPRLQIAPATGT